MAAGLWSATAPRAPRPKSCARPLSTSSAAALPIRTAGSIACSPSAKDRDALAAFRLGSPAMQARARGVGGQVTPVGEIIGAVGHCRFTPGTICRLMREDYDRLVGKKVAVTAA